MCFLCFLGSGFKKKNWGFFFPFREGEFGVKSCGVLVRVHRCGFSGVIELQQWQQLVGLGYK